MTVTTTSAADIGAARSSDYRFFGIERVDLKARYGARCDGGSHPLSGLYASVATAQIAYPNAGVTSANWSTMEVDTAAWLQAEYDLRTGSGGIIGLADNATMRVSQQLWLQTASTTWFHGGRNASLVTEGTGSTPAIRLSKASGGDSGPAQTVPLRQLCLRAFNSGRPSFAPSAGVAYPGLASSAAIPGTRGGYRTGATALLIEGGGTGYNSVHVTLDAVKWFNYDESLSWGDDVYCIKFLDCFAEANNKGASWSQSGGLNSMENILFQGGNYSNNNYGFYWVSTFTDSSGTNQSQGGSVFIRSASIDYNIVSQGVFQMAPPNNSYPQNSVHIGHCHIENNPGCIGPGPWFSLQGRGSWNENEIYINGASPTGMVTIGDNASGSMVNNRIGGNASPLFVSSTSNYKSVFGYGNECNPVGKQIVLLRDNVGSAVQPAPISVPLSVDYYQDNLLYTVADFGVFRDIFLSTTCTKFTLPANGADSFRPGHCVTIWNKSTSGVVFYVPEGVTLGGLRGYTQPSAGQGTIAGQSIPANSMIMLRKADDHLWAVIGGFPASAPS